MKKVFLFVLLMGLVAAGVLGRRWWLKTNAEAMTLAAAPVAAVVVPDSMMLLPGRVSAGGNEPLHAIRAGRVRNVYFGPGAYVRKGAVLIKLADYTFVTAPHDGFMGERRVEVGQYITAATVVSTISRLPGLLVSVPLPAGFVGGVRPGDSVQVRPADRPAVLVTGVVAAHPVDSNRLEISFPSRAPLRIGEAASVQLRR